MTAQVERRTAKTFRDGTDRLVSPDETVARVRPYVAAMGITRVANVTGLDTIGVPVVMVCRPNSRSLAVSQGKGLTLAAAQASGLMESVESFHAERIRLPLLLSSMDELSRDRVVIDAGLLPRPLGSPFTSHRRILWIEGHDLMQDEPVWVPYDAVHDDFTVTAVCEPDARSFPPTSNGLASGNHLLEAISHAICEVVERDAEVLWHLQPHRFRRDMRIDPDTVDDPSCRWVLDCFKGAGVLVGIWDMTSDIGIPAFLCVIAERDGTVFRPLSGAGGQGAHPVRAIALLRALTEAAQSRLTVIAGSRDDTYREEYARTTETGTLARNRDDLMVSATRSFAGSSFGGATFEEDVAWELERLRAVGIERVVAVDLTLPEFGIPVVRIVIPGLEFHPEGREYTSGPRAKAALAGWIQDEIALRQIGEQSE